MAWPARPNPTVGCFLSGLLALACDSRPIDLLSVGNAGMGGGLLLGDDPVCGGTGGEGGATDMTFGGAPDCSAEPVVGYDADVAPILARCVGEACHNFGTRQNVRAWIGASADECCDRRALIAPGHPEASYLVDKLRNRNICQGSPMPRGRQPLPAADLATLEAWICQGATLP